MILVYITERMIKLNCPTASDHMLRKGISCQQFSTNPLITLFTWHYKNKKQVYLPMLDLIWDLIVLVDWLMICLESELGHCDLDLPLHRQIVGRVHFGLRDGRLFGVLGTLLLFE